MLEFYEDHEEALKVLNDYAYDHTFPPNPNAHVYLYQYLKRHDPSERKLMKVLKVRTKITKTCAFPLLDEQLRTHNIQWLMLL